MEEDIFSSLMEDLIIKYHCKEEITDTDTNTSAKNVKNITIELLRGKYKTFPYYFFASMVGIFLCVFFSLLLQLDSVSIPICIPIMTGTILWTYYKKRKFKNYFIEINHGVFSLVEKKSGKEIVSTPLDQIKSDIVYIAYTSDALDFAYTILKLCIPQFATLRIATTGKQAAFHPKRIWKWFGEFYTYHYVIDNKSWERLTKKIHTI